MNADEETLVLKDREFFGANSIQTVRTINDTFDLGIDIDLRQLETDIHDSLETLRNPNIGDMHALLLAALGPLGRGASDADGHLPERPEIKTWRRLGHDDIAAVIEDWYDLAKDVKIETRNSGTEDAYPEIANAAEIRRKLADLETRLDPLVAELPYRAQDIPDLICRLFRLDLQPEHKFREYWIGRILNSKGFATYAPPRDEHGRPLDEPFGWLTKGYVKALRSHGYTYRFSFWEEPMGDMRGDLWIQTDRSPLILTDRTDSVSLKSDFPVQVANLARKKLFKLRAGDVDADPRKKKPVAQVDWLKRFNLRR